jgi:hypothetical protein
MAGKVNFGSRVFPALGQGKLKQGETAKNQLRLSAQSGSAPLIALNQTAQISTLINIVPGSGLIRIKDIIAFVEFADAGVAVYNVSERAKVYLSAANYGNLDTGGVFTPFLFNQSRGMPYDILAQVINNQITIGIDIYGGDVVNLTGITPGAADTILTQVTVFYEPL